MGRIVECDLKDLIGTCYTNTMHLLFGRSCNTPNESHQNERDFKVVQVCDVQLSMT